MVRIPTRFRIPMGSSLRLCAIVVRQGVLTPVLKPSSGPGFQDIAGRLRYVLAAKHI